MSFVPLKYIAFAQSFLAAKFRTRVEARVGVPVQELLLLDHQPERQRRDDEERRVEGG